MCYVFNETLIPYLLTIFYVFYLIPITIIFKKKKKPLKLHLFTHFINQAELSK